MGCPQGKILHPRDRYYRRWVCDKHGNEEIFNTNMMANPGKPERSWAWTYA